MTLKSIPTPGVPMSAAGDLTPGIQFGMPGWSLDLPQGVIYANKTPIKLVPAIVSTLALKLIFFSGEKASAGAKALWAKRKSGTPALATNPRRKRRRSRRR